ncbi:serine protease [Treponema sp.]|uniref:trypsin-like peptidase domain-containing protein n=1 Tax=Treponema sp. TaxID=166 RepID=UPI0025D51BF9|nr:serine protease [Treponema sp.]MCR5218926.1 serine protease [Treponema sp.]
MKKMLKTLFISAMLAVTSSAFAQIRSYVGVVRQQYYPEHVKYFEDYRDELKDQGYSTYAGYVDSYLEGGFGSGFIVVTSDGTNYVVTNRHVVSQAATASVEFEDGETGKVTKYEGLTVVLTDDDIDIAILGFKNGAKPFKKGLTLSSSKISDGAEVWSAGFPGLGSEPAWQLGKGTATNASARIKELLDPSISTIIQHSAQIDAGNSGGPLMVASSKGTAGYEVIGINTWKAYQRDSTNFAIPAAVIKDMIDRAQKKLSAQEDKALLDSRIAKFSDALASSEYYDLVKYISYDRASKSGQEDFEATLHFASSKIRSSVLEAFAYSPAEGLRYACAYQLWKKYGSESNDGLKYACGKSEKNGDKASVVYTASEEDSFTAQWIKEHGLWRIESFSFDEKDENGNVKTKSNSKNKNKDKNKNSSSGLSFAAPELSSWDSLVLTAGADISLNGDPLAFALGMDLFASSDFTGWSFMYQRFTVESDIESFDLNNVGVGAVLRIPVKTGSFGFVPYGKILGTIGYGNSICTLGYTAEAGLQVMFRTDSSVHFGIGAGYKQTYVTEFMDTSTDEFDEDNGFDNFTAKALTVYGIISF